MSKVILLYSKYSNHCNKLINGLHRSPVKLNIDMLCIDNKNIRNIMEQSTNVLVEAVPCVMVIKDDSVEKYEGEKAFRWISEEIRKSSPPRSQKTIRRNLTPHEPRPVVPPASRQPRASQAGDSQPRASQPRASQAGASQPSNNLSPPSMKAQNLRPEQMEVIAGANDRGMKIALPGTQPVQENTYKIMNKSDVMAEAEKMRKLRENEANAKPQHHFPTNR